MPKRWEWALTIGFNILMVGLLVAGYYTDDWRLYVAGLGVAAMTMGFGHAVKRADRRRAGLNSD